MSSFTIEFLFGISISFILLCIVSAIFLPFMFVGDRSDHQNPSIFLCGIFSVIYFLLGIITPLFFLLTHVPSKHKEDVVLWKKAIVLFILCVIPLILYLIGAFEHVQIINVLFACIMLGYVLVYYIFYGHKSNDKRIEISKFILSLGVLIFQIIYSINLYSEYSKSGIADNLVYMLVFNIWAYTVIAGLILTKARRIQWVSISLATVLVLTSCHPWNVKSLYRDYLIERFNQLVSRYPIEKPFDNDAMKKRLINMPDEEARELYQLANKIEDFDIDLFDHVMGLRYREHVSYDTYETLLAGIRTSSYSMKYVAEDFDFKYSMPAGFKYVQLLMKRLHWLLLTAMTLLLYIIIGYMENS